MSHIRKLYFLKQILSLSILKRNVQNLTVLRIHVWQRCYAGLGILKTHYQNYGGFNVVIYGYARVSAKAQLKGNSLEEQRIELERSGCEVIIEEQYTGKTTSRPKFEELVTNQLQHGDTLIVTKLDRFARNVTEGISTIRYLFDNHNVIGLCPLILTQKIA